MANLEFGEEDVDHLPGGMRFLRFPVDTLLLEGVGR
ncbi:hypothetical protein Vi05172_g12704 [Venturia inaequalis]|nr:hypothetical protein Vi05172_g12704 [Venturia inaequalis]